MPPPRKVYCAKCGEQISRKGLFWLHRTIARDMQHVAVPKD